MEDPPDKNDTIEMTARPFMVMENPHPRGLKEALGFDGYRPEDRWLWFAVRLSMVLFFIGIQVVIILAFAKVMLAI